MSKRVAVAAANWKMNKTIAEAKAYMAELKSAMAEVKGEVEVVVFAPFTTLTAVAEGAAGSQAAVGGQDCYWAASGAYTGEVSIDMLKDAGCSHVLVGHSERRRRFGVPEPELTTELGDVFGDNDATVNKKLLAAVEGGLAACLCVGETLAERQRGETDAVIEIQLRRGLQNVDAATARNLLIAYEPVWAIGTGEVCAADEANRVCGVVRCALAGIYDTATAEAVRVLYGGSMKPDNVAGLVALEHIDGGLVGGASLEVKNFKPIIDACAAS
ncbi:MAG: triose-phosphate isomerase [Armatimonadetes bacterium]|nr:triose-phosphate isomerase [Armatimonadota bacterium]